MEEITRSAVPITPNPSRERDERNTIDAVPPNNDTVSSNNISNGKDGSAHATSQNSSVTNLPADADASKPTTQLNGRATATATSTSHNQILSSQTTVVAKKASKNVSFEDNDSNSSDRESLIEQSFYIRRGKHHYSASPTLEILSKKDRRRTSGIKSNGFFGVEGKAQMNVLSYASNIYSIVFLQLGKYTSNSQPEEAALNGSQNSTSNSDTNKKLDEITPLFNHQATISSNSVENDSEPNTNTNGRSGGHKITYRKRVKTKKDGRKST